MPFFAAILMLRMMRVVNTEHMQLCHLETKFERPESRYMSKLTEAVSSLGQSIQACVRIQTKAGVDE